MSRPARTSARRDERDGPGTGPLDLSVVVCTRDRAPELARTLDGLTRARIPEALRWELLVVDNGSTDATGDVLHGFGDRLPVRVAREPRPGLSIARNRALDEARGDALLWTDDDITVGADWIERYVEALAAHPECGFFGGAIRAAFRTGTPAWAAAAWPHVSRYWAVREPPDVGAPVTPDYVPYGANFAIRREIQRRYPYDPELGRRPGDLRSGEEWDVLRRALADGVRGRWVAAAVDHRIGAERATPEFVCAVARAIGRAGAETLAGAGPTWRGRPVRLWRVFAGLSVRYALARLAGDPAKWVPLALERARARGQLDGAGAGPGTPGAGDGTTETSR